MGEKRGRGTATDESVRFDEILSDEETLPTVCLLLRGMTDLPVPGKSSCDCDRALNEREARSMERDSRSDSEGIVESCELQL